MTIKVVLNVTMQHRSF